MSIRKILICFFCIAALLTGCSAKNESVQENEEEVQETPAPNEEEQAEALKEFTGTYQLVSLKISGNEYFTDYTLQQQEENGTQLKMTILDEGSCFIDFISEQHRGHIYPETSTIRIGTNSFPITYEEGVLTMIAEASDYVYTFEKKENLSPVKMYYANKYIMLEDPYLLPWAMVPNDEENNLFLFSKQIWLVGNSYPKDDDSEALQVALSLFNGGDPAMELSEGAHYNYTEEGDAFFLDVLFVAPVNYHYIRMWCPAADRDVYQDIMVDLMSNHVLLLEYYQ